MAAPLAIPQTWERTAWGSAAAPGARNAGERVSGRGVCYREYAIGIRRSGRNLSQQGRRVPKDLEDTAELLWNSWEAQDEPPRAQEAPPPAGQELQLLVIQYLGLQAMSIDVMGARADLKQALGGLVPSTAVSPAVQQDLDQIVRLQS